MERIVIEINEATTKKGHAMPARGRAYLEKSFAEQIEEVCEQLKNHDVQQLKKDDFKKFLHELGATMKKRGLTEEKLMEILKADA